jgi:hypothetical protein
MKITGMEIQYQNTHADLKAYYRELWRHRKALQRNEYYQTALWYLAVLGLAGYIALKHDEVFAVCVFAVLAAFYIRQNWSFERQWNAGAESYADMVPESSCNLVLNETGITERCSGVQLHVSWSEIHGYTLEEERIFIHFLKHRSFVIPLRHLSVSQRDELTKTLEHHSVHKTT